ncbi:MAG: LLM class F420-dependent oxidoreductase [Dehalococcoidia bacterium]|nr:LLM class F420-dependent oxidoreductase [Dehalococcoidia bacterium]
MIKFGIQQPSHTFPQMPPRGERPADGHAVFRNVQRIAQEAERVGFDSFWVMDHFIQIPFVGAAEEPILEPYTALAALAAATSRIRLGTMVTGTPYRNPAHLAKIGATLDVISNGRLFMGIGAGWFEREFNAYGWEFPPLKDRMGRLREALQIIIKMWTEERPSFQGKYYTIADVICEPRPVQRPRPPILIGGGGEQVTLRLVAQYAEASNLFGNPESLKRKYDILAKHCADVGRDPASILKTRLGQMVIARNEAELTRKLARYYPGGLGNNQETWGVVAGTPEQCIEQCQQLVDAGAEYPIFSFPDAETLEPLHLFAEEVAPKLNA